MGRASKYEESRQQLLEHIQRASRGKSPTVRDLADECEVGVATMHAWLTRLAGEGLITWRPGKHRSLRLTPMGSQQLSSLVP